MFTESELAEYREEIQERVCSRCIERPHFGPPCAQLGKECGIEMHLPQFLAAIHEVESDSIEPYLDSIHRRVCNSCPRLGGEGCPCPLDYLLVLLVQAVETVDQRKGMKRTARVGPSGLELCGNGRAMCGNRPN